MSGISTPPNPDLVIKHAATCSCHECQPVLGDGEFLFRRVTDAKSEIGCVRGMNDSSLRILHQWLTEKRQFEGTPGRIWSITTFVAAERFMKGGRQ